MSLNLQEELPAPLTLTYFVGWDLLAMSKSFLGLTIL